MLQQALLVQVELVLQILFLEYQLHILQAAVVVQLVLPLLILLERVVVILVMVELVVPLH